MAGGLLVAVAAVGIFAAYTDATTADRHRYVVARRDLPLGHRLTAADLATLPMELPPPIRRRSTQNVSRLVGAVVVGPVGRGELVQASDVVRGSADAGASPEVSIPVEPARALDGRLQVGEFVDVIATYDAGGDGYTAVVARGARVIARSRPRTALGEGGKEVVSLAVTSPGETLAVAHASNAGVVTLVRAAVAPASAPDSPAAYRAPGPAVGPASAPPRTPG